MHIAHFLLYSKLDFLSHFHYLDILMENRKYQIQRSEHLCEECLIWRA